MKVVVTDSCLWILLRGKSESEVRKGCTILRIVCRCDIIKEMNQNKESKKNKHENPKT